jgi:hypothetical protein
MMRDLMESPFAQINDADQILANQIWEEVLPVAAGLNACLGELAIPCTVTRCIAQPATTAFQTVSKFIGYSQPCSYR